MRHVVYAMNKKSSVRQAGTTRSDAPPIFGDDSVVSTAKRSPLNDGPNQHTKPAVNVLPPDHETEMLIRAFFANTGLLFPFIHEQTFCDTYHRLKQKNFSTGVRRTWLGLLNIILAMAKCTTGPTQVDPRICQTPADVFYRRGKELCKTQMLRGTTLETGALAILLSS
jgi:hypothetical protein